jgi:tetratricopeptide (TPR) repeat protein
MGAAAAGAIAIALGLGWWWYGRETQSVPSLATIAGWMTRQRYAEAELALREYLRRSPDDGEARTMLARLLAARGDARGCARELRRVPSWWPTKAEARFREGQTYLRIDRAREAETAWLALIQQDVPQAPPAVFQDACLELLRLYAVEDRWEDAAPLIWIAYDRAAPADRALWLILRLRSELERLAHWETLALLRRYVAADPEDGEVPRALARAEQALGRPAEATGHFRLCLARHPDDARAWRDYLALLLAQGDRDGFLAALAQAPAAPSEPQLGIYHGLEHEWRGDLEGAARLYRQAVARNPSVVEYHYRLALAERRLGRTEVAAEHLQRARDLREARRRLPGQFMRYLDVRGLSSGPAQASMAATALEQLAATCTTLGWTRAAAACTAERTRAEQGWGG